MKRFIIVVLLAACIGLGYARASCMRVRIWGNIAFRWPEE